MLQYTRYRRWTRIAVLDELVEPVSADEVRRQAQYERGKSKPSMPGPAPPVEGEEPHSAVADAQDAQKVEDDAESTGSGHKGLKKRLKAVVHGSIHP